MFLKMFVTFRLIYPLRFQYSLLCSRSDKSAFKSEFMTIKINEMKGLRNITLFMGLVAGQAKPQCTIPLCLNTELPFKFPVYSEIFLPWEPY